MKILIVNGPNYAAALERLGEFVYDYTRFLEDKEKIDLIVFTGGEDVDPSIYGDTSPNNLCRSNIHRDIEEVKVFNKAVKLGIPMTGICRGSQFLNVMCGGKLVHHMNNHAGSNHMMMTADGQEFAVTTSHHQMSILSSDAVLLGWSSDKRSTEYIGDEDRLINYTGLEIEAFCYPQYKVFAVQYHPEWMPEKTIGYQWFKNTVQDLVTMSMGEFVNKHTTSLKEISAV